MKLTDTQFKQNLESISIEDIQNLRKAKQIFPIQKQLSLIAKGKYTKSDIGALTKLLAGAHFDTPERKEQISAFLDLAFEYTHNEYVHSNFQCEYHFFKKGGLKITKEQTLLGKAWLKNHFFKLNGQPRGGKNTEYVSDRVLRIAKSVSKFEFVGVIRVTDPRGYCNQVLPVYRTFSKNGSYFDYSPIHWGQPIIVEGL